MVDFSEILCLLMCFQWKKIRNLLSGFHEQRAAQTLSPSVNVITSGTEGSDFSVFAFFLFSQSLPLSEEEQTAAQLLNLQTWKNMEFSVEEVIRECQYSKNLSSQVQLSSF